MSWTDSASSRFSAQKDAEALARQLRPKPNEIIGVGTDIEDISRFCSNAVQKNKQFLDSIFTKKEQKMCFRTRLSGRRLASRFAGKEAVMKAVSGLGLEMPAYMQVEILGGVTAAPKVKIHSSAYDLVSVSVSLSHSEGNAMAFAIARCPKGLLR